MKYRFYEKIREILANKGKNNQLLTSDKYMSLMMKVKVAKIKTAKKTPKDYWRLARYDVIRIEASERLIVPVKNEGNPIIYYAHLEESFQIIHDCHISIGHGGRTRMRKLLKSTYKNITAEIITIYLNLCKSCRKRRSYKQIIT